MNKNAKEFYRDRILLRLEKQGSIRVSETASWLFLNKKRVRRFLDWMVSAGYLNKKTIKYAGNANMNVYTRK